MPATATIPSLNSRLDPEVVRGFLRFARVVAWITLAAALAIMVGWWQKAPALAALFIGTRPIRLATGIGFMVAAAALLTASSATPHAQRLQLPLALALLLLGALSLIDRLGLFDLGPQHWLLVSPAGSYSATMPLVISAFFVALGLHAAIHCCLRNSWVAEALAVVMVGISMAALAAQGVSAAAGADSILSPATAAAAALLFVNAIAWIAVRPASPLCAVAAARGYGGYIARRLLLPAMLLPLAYSWLIEWARSRLGLDDALLIALSAFITGGSVAILIWWVARLSGYIHYQRSRAAVLTDIAHTDALSGLANRRAFDTELAARLRDLRSDDRGFSLLLLDADRFKAYNDNFGHPAGDEALQGMGQLLRRSLRPGDHAARIGGEEFAVLLPDTDLDAARLAGERIRSAFAAHPWPRRMITASMGVAQAQKSDTATALMARADGALYAAKNAGRDRIMAAAAPVPAHPAQRAGG